LLGALFGGGSSAKKEKEVAHESFYKIENIPEIQPKLDFHRKMTIDEAESGPSRRLRFETKIIEEIPLEENKNSSPCDTKPFQQYQIRYSEERTCPESPI
jgi:hypothetical protein